VRAPRKRRPARAPQTPARSRQQRVELLEPLVDGNEVGAALGYQLHAEPVASEHLEDESAEIANALFSLAQQRALLTFEHRWM
jgi:hypothetical protein